MVLYCYKQLHIFKYVGRKVYLLKTNYVSLFYHLLYFNISAQTL